MGKFEFLEAIRELNNVELCEMFGDNEEASCKGCPLKSDTPEGCLMDDIENAIEAILL